MSYDLIIRGGSIVNGEVLMRSNEHTGALPGKLLRGPLAPSA